MENIKEQLAELLEVESVNENDKLADFECWDSLTALTIIASADENYGVTLSNKELDEAGTIGGLITLIKTKKGYEK